MDSLLNGGQIRALALAMAAIVLAVSLSGCIQTELGRSLLFKEEKKKVEYGVSPILDSLNYEFNTYTASTNTDQENFEVKEGARWVAITISVTICVLYPSSILDRIQDQPDPDPVRFVNVLITDPENNILFYTFSSSTVCNLDPFVKPMPGLWKVQVFAQGRGIDDPNPLSDEKFYDGYSISGSINQPI